jgi:cell division protease FtsH
LNATIKNLLLWMVILVLIILAWNVFKTGTTAVEEVSFSQFLDRVGQGQVQKVTIRGEEIRGTYAPSAGRREPVFKTYSVNYPDLIKELRARGVEIEVSPMKDSSLISALVMYGPLILLVAIWFVIMRQMQAGGNKALSFGKSRAKLLTPTQKKVTFKDVAGVEEAKIELQEIIEFLKDPQKFQKLGGKIPKGVLLMGPPGTGKTLLARSVAGEANVPFFTISGSDFVEMFVGVGASRVRDLFEQGKAHAPCIIFIDEIDAVGRHRGAGLGGGHDEREQTLNQLLVEMDGFESNEGVILIAATNRPDVLDPALLRPGRFDRQVVVDMPDVRGREAILKVHAREKPLARTVRLDIVAKATPGLAGADLANIVNEAALLAARRGRSQVEMSDFEDAKDKVMLGVERKSLVLSEEEKRLTAYHEAGHTIVSLRVPGVDPVHKVSIVPRGRSLGLTFWLPEEDRHNYTKEYILGRLAMSYGGRVAEELIFGLAKVTTGAAQDIQQATELARRMVTQFGMSDVIGPIAVGEREQQIFLGREISQRHEVSEKTAELVDAEIKRVLDDALNRARTILESEMTLLHKMAAALLERETLDREEVELLAAGKELPPKAPVPPAVPAPRSEKERTPAPDRKPVLGTPPPEPAGA